MLMFSFKKALEACIDLVDMVKSKVVLQSRAPLTGGTSAAASRMNSTPYFLTCLPVRGHREARQEFFFQMYNMLNSRTSNRMTVF